MGEAILKTIDIMGWLGLILLILVLVNISCGIYTNISKGEKFSWIKLFKGLIKAVIFYISSAAVGVAFTMLPFVNEMITNAFDVTLIANETLNTLSSVSVLGVVAAAIITQAKKALEGIIKLANINSSNNTKDKK